MKKSLIVLILLFVCSYAFCSKKNAKYKKLNGYVSVKEHKYKHKKGGKIIEYCDLQYRSYH